MTNDLISQLTALAWEAVDSATDEWTRTEARGVADRLGAPLRLAIAGRVKAGKSTLLNALIGEELAPTDAGECTRVVTWYRYSQQPHVVLHPLSGDPSERPYRRKDGALQIDLGGHAIDAIDHLEVWWPTRLLQELVLIDTPGIASLSTDVSARTHRALESHDGRGPVADAVLYLLRHAHASDLRFLEAFHDDDVVQGTPVNTVGVLSRADEVGSARLDAMDAAARVAERYQNDPRLRRLCPVLVPVNALLGHAAVTLRESEFAALRTIASTPAPALAELLLTADRVSAPSAGTSVEPAVRQALLERLGLFGLRLSVELIRSARVSDSSALAAELSENSGLERLRSIVHEQIASRAGILKARSSVDALSGLLARGAVRDVRRLAARLEELTASAHAFEEVRLLLELRSGRLALSVDHADRLDRLLGGSGDEAVTRLGLPPEAGPDGIHAAAIESMDEWRRVAEHPLSSRPVQVAARAAVRTLEGLL
jgi:hypothetical protein